MSIFDADELYDIVASYAEMGCHHTGTPVDHATTAWLCDVLKGLGAEVEQEPFDFERYECTIDLQVGGERVPAVPLYYSAVGDWQTDDLQLIELDMGVVGNAAKLPLHLPPADTDGALVLAIEGPDDLAVQCNRVPTELYGRPAVVIPHNWAERVASDGRLAFTASLEPGRSANVLAVLGEPDAPPLSITTPLTGWTPAAGERGTGLAVALAMAAELSAQHRVTFSACSGHEIDHIGLHHHLASRDVSDQPVIHLGASVAAIEPGSTGPAELGDRRLSLTTATGQVRSEIELRVPAANWELVDMDPWAGEGGTWRDAGASVLSFLGGSSVFHTMADTLAATSPPALALAAEVAIDCARIFVQDC